MKCRTTQRVFSVISVLAMAASASAATIEVGVVGNAFVPPDIKIDVGDTVHWTWNSGFHNVESGVGGVYDDNFRSGEPAASGDFSVVFDQAFLDANSMPGNVYPYYCVIHVGGGMVGSVTVNKPPPPIPAVSEWGLLLMAVLVLGVAGLIVRRRRAAVG